jgi:hypothetical protein
MRRRSVLVSGMSGVLTSAIALGHTTRAQGATPTAMAGHPFVGTWIVSDPADPTGMPTTNIITADGGLIDPSVGAAGVWTATGERTADFTLIALVTEDGGSYFLVRGSLDVDAGGDTATAMVSVTHVAPDGTVLDQPAQATATYLRLKVEPQDAVGQPLAGFPAWTPQAAATPTP